MFAPSRLAAAPLATPYPSDEAGLRTVGIIRLSARGVVLIVCSFCEEHNVQARAANPFTPPPACRTLFAFFLWLTRDKRGILKSKVMVVTVRGYWVILQRIVKLDSGF